MTERDLYDAALIEINKLEAPSMLLEDYNYFINKAIQQYINRTYNRYEMNQQATDDLQALKVNKAVVVYEFSSRMPNESKHYFGILPGDYMHMLNCVVAFQKSGDYDRCGKVDTNPTYLATKLTSDIYPSIINNAYFKPSYKRPYYTISEITEKDIITETAVNPCIEVPRDTEDLVESVLNPCDSADWKGGKVINIRCGDTKKFEPKMIYIDYIKTPRLVNITENDLYGEDVTKEMEFPEYVCYEIINEFVKLLLENASDPRLQTNIPINQTIVGTSD